jgi:hypothetical protein
MPNKEVLTPVPEWKGKLSFGSHHSYWWHDKKGVHPLSGVTSVLNVIAKPALIPWAVKMCVEYIMANATEILGDGRVVEGYEISMQTLMEAKGAHTRKTTHAAGLGTDAHADVEAYIKQCLAANAGIPLLGHNLLAPSDRVVEFAEWAATRNSQTGFRFILAEVPLADPKLAIAGTPDFIGEELIDGVWVPVIGDLKTGSGIYDRVYFFQMAAYGYMWMKWVKRTAKPKLVIIHMPAQKPDQPLAEYWSEDFKGDWEGFKAALIIHRRKDNFAKAKKY